MNKSILSLLVFTLFLQLGCSSGSSNEGDAIDQKVDSLLSIMTLEEKVGQMNQYASFYNVTGPRPEEGTQKERFDQLKNGQLGSMLSVFGGVEHIRKLQEIAVNETRLGIPLIFAFDVIHGFKTIAPIPLAESCSWDLEEMEKSARIAAIEASASGVNWTFAPMVDIFRDPRWGRVMEGAGEDAFLGSKIAIARIKGFQGDDLSADNTILACAKHFAGYGFSEAGRDYNNVDISSQTLYNVILPPFQASVEEGDVKTIMNSFNTVNGIPATGNKLLQRDILKGKWGFKGFVVSDWNSCGEMVSHGYAKDLKEAAKYGAIAGSDMDMESKSYVTHLVELVKDGEVSEDVIDEAAGRILRLKYELGLMDDPYKYCDEAREKELIHHPDHRKAALDMAKKSIVLLKNENKLLPISKDQKKIAVIGSLANDSHSPLGSWRGLADDKSAAVTVVDGIKKFTENITYAKGMDVSLKKSDFLFPVQLNTSDRSGFAKAIQTAKSSELVIMVLGEDGFQTGESRSMASIKLQPLQRELLEKVLAVNKNVVLVVMNGRPLDLSWEHENVPAIVEAWQLGSETGNAIAEVLFGAYNPSGKLTMSFPKTVGQVPIYYNKFNTGRPGNPEGEEMVFWSHYEDVDNEPLYPFGYGLSYTTFEYSDFIATAEGKEVKVAVTVTNTGEVKGEEVVQLYIRDKVASNVRPIKELKGFDKIELAAGESKTVNFTLTEKELGFFTNAGDFVFEAGDFDIMVGTNSSELISKEVTIE